MPKKRTKKKAAPKRKRKKAAAPKKKRSNGGMLSRFGCTFQVSVMGGEPVRGIKSMTKALQIAKQRSKGKNGRPGPVTSVEMDCAQPLVGRCLEGTCHSYKAPRAPRAPRAVKPPKGGFPRGWPGGPRPPKA